jgi:hypothetical protein
MSRSDLLDSLLHALRTDHLRMGRSTHSGLRTSSAIDQSSVFHMAK